MQTHQSDAAQSTVSGHLEAMDDAGALRQAQTLPIKQQQQEQMVIPVEVIVYIYSYFIFIYMRV